MSTEVEWSPTTSPSSCTRTERAGKRSARAALYDRFVRTIVLIALTSCAAHPAAPPAADMNARVPVVIETSAGDLHCTVDGTRAPHAASMVVHLARGEASWRDPKTGHVVSRPYYDGLPFFRSIPGVLAQTGCAVGDGSSTPGYRIPIEAGEVELLSKPGVLLLARYQPPPNRIDPNPPRDPIGAQLVVALADMSHLAGQVTVLGQCGELDAIQRITEGGAYVVRVR